MERLHTITDDVCEQEHALVRHFELLVERGRQFARGYHAILCKNPPEFLYKYAECALVKRLGGVSLLCGTEWTPLFKNDFFYSRLAHSVGAALIVWNFTQSKVQTLAALFHDVASPAFSHVTDFRNKDALRQSSTEAPTKEMIAQDAALQALLLQDGITSSQIDDYHLYSIADNEIPRLSADRLEYMYPSGAALCGEWTLAEIQENYAHITVLKNEDGQDELGFDSEQAALVYTQKFCAVSRLLQKNEDKCAMQLLADILTEAISLGALQESELYRYDEKTLLHMGYALARQNPQGKFARLLRTFLNTKTLIRSQTNVPNAYTVSLAVKRRYVDPLVQDGFKSQPERISKKNKEAARCIEDFLSFTDTPFAAAPWVD